MPSRSSADSFDPYRKWFGLRTSKPSHYELLGVDLDEDDPEVLDLAKERRLSFVRTQLGKGHDDAVARLTHQIQEAHLTLSDPGSRRDYDQRRKLFAKRKRRRQVDPNAGGAYSGAAGTLPPRVGGNAPVGEQADFLRGYAGIVAILAIAFGGMVWWSFQQPWEKLAGGDGVDEPNALFAAIEADGRRDAAEGPDGDGPIAGDVSAAAVSKSPQATDAKPLAERSPVSEWVDLLAGPLENKWTAWKSTGRMNVWKRRGGTLVFPNPGATPAALCSRERYDDFELVVECRTGKDANAAIFLRVPPDAGKVPANAALELNLGHFFDHVKKFGPGHEYGSLMRFTKLTRATAIPVDDGWHTIRLRMLGPAGECFLDGEPAYRFDTSTRWWQTHREEMGWHRRDYGQTRRGPIVVLPGHGDVSLRTLKVRPLDAAAERPIFAPRDPSARPSVIQTRTEDSDRNDADYARLVGPNSFEVGLSDSGWGFGSVGWLVDNVSTIVVDARVEGPFKRGTAVTSMGVLVDYETRNGYRKRVLLTPMDGEVTGSAAPRFGAWMTPEVVHTSQARGVTNEREGLYRADLSQWAPADWTHRAWIIAHLQDTGANTRFSGAIRFLN